ncbi:hypothetical protein FIU82_05725 [Pseudoalteromonas sp. THAF3]|uniref:hypothetical protein n=1 Tax=Pseudoalteromonas TaxID=53246 RepID=UPI0012684699|nr:MULTISPECIES: hypothetical protein [Pseudoalteromonas]MCG7571174.1 hypothetical protein [Pseudoalteromonas sp. CNC9-20]QFU04516.1 hypothetical protein FIU82_05725 [Pseudoalteromonas sp. THAF3]|tara:strand:- start:11390 stop:11959 length:570 start_codon:yes stop_codon:yes gene_type:complete
MKRFTITAILLLIGGCAQQPRSDDVNVLTKACVGSTALPAQWQGQFRAVDNPELLQSALGEPQQGKLCQGQVYESTQPATVILYRAYNSTNPNSRFGSWWAWAKPSGTVSEYRANYEICYQWSPLDKLVRCELKPGVQVVVGNGQSAQCSEYLRYDVSAVQQVFIADADDAVHNCSDFNAVMQWQPIQR